MRPVKNSRSVLAIELVRHDAPRPLWWEAVISLPGRHGTMTRRFDCPGGVMDDLVMDEIRQWALETLGNAIFAFYGVQGVMPGN